MRLTKIGKIIFTLIAILISGVVYKFMGEFGAKVQNNTIYLAPLIIGWFWLLCGQIFVYLMIWGEE